MNLLDLLSRELKVVLLSTLPVIELRGAIPYAISQGIHPLHSIFLCIVGSMIPVPFLLFFLKPMFAKLKNIPLLRSFEKWLVKRTERKALSIKKYSILGLVLFVAIPLPSTGVWTGAIAASLFNMRIRSAFFAIFIGNTIAAVIISFVSHIAIIKM